MKQKVDFEEKAGAVNEAPEQREFKVIVTYDQDNPYQLINVNCARSGKSKCPGSNKGRYNFIVMENSARFFLSISPKKIGTKETVTMKLFPHVNGEVIFPKGWRSANIVEFAYAGVQTNDFEEFKHEFLVGIVGQKISSRFSWTIPMLVLRSGALRSSNNSEFQNEILAYGKEIKTQHVFSPPIYFLGVKEAGANRRVRKIRFRVSIANRSFYFDKESIITANIFNLVIIEPDFEEEKCVLENEYYRREITLPQFIEDQLNEVGLPFTQIYRDKKGRKKLVAQFN